MGEGVLIACICMIALLVLFVSVTFLMTYKNIKFDFEGGVLKVRTMGSHLRIYFNEKLVKDIFSPHLLKGEKVDFNIGEKSFSLHAKSNSLGNKLSVKVFEGENVVLDNNVEI